MSESAPRLLYLEASPMAERSYSSRIAQTFLDRYLELNPHTQVDHLNLFETHLPEFDRTTAQQKYNQINQLMQGKGKPKAESEWQRVLDEIARLKAADKVLMSVPMWNFSIPYKLKHYLDIVCQPAESFTVNPTTGEYQGLITGKPLQLILASSSQYPEAFPQEQGPIKQDFQSSYLRHIARFLGFTDVRLLKVAPTTAAPKQLAAMMENWQAEAVQAATDF